MRLVHGDLIVADSPTTNVLVVGASGLVGRCLLAALRRQGYSALGTQCSSRHDGLLRFDLGRDRIGDVLPVAFLKPKQPAYMAICGGVTSMAARTPIRRTASR